MSEFFPAPLVRVLRAGLAESLHRGHVALVRADGSGLKSLGDPDHPTFLRSAAKPFQAVPVVEEGAADRYGIAEAELAAMCGSLSGQDFHVAAVRSALSRAGLDESLLACGLHKPSHRPTAKRMEERGEPVLPVHNNCAGKHAAMLVLCAHKGWPAEGYTRPDHPVQVLIRAYVASACGLAPEDLGLGVDGCGVPVFRAPLRAVARGFARLAAPETDPSLPPDRAASLRRVFRAALAHPEMIAGDDRICTEAMRAAPGRFLAKSGSEGSYGIGFADGPGLALKVEDGGMRAIPPLVVELLFRKGEIDAGAVEALVRFHRPPVTNHRRETVGRLEPDPSLGEPFASGLFI